MPLTIEELDQLSQHLAEREHARTSKPIPSVGDWQRELAEAQKRRFHASRERAQRQHEAREAAHARTRAARERLEAKIRKLNADEADQLDGLVRKTAQIKAAFASKRDVLTDGLADLDLAIQEAADGC
jgi:hypothetical protein